MSVEKYRLFEEAQTSEEALLSEHDVDPERQAAGMGGASDKPWKSRRAKLSSFVTRHGMVIHLIFFVLYTTVFFSLPIDLKARVDTSWHLKTPPREAIKMDRRVLHNGVDAINAFKGPPSPELDLAWHNILQNANIRLTADDLRRMNRTSVQLADGSGDFAGSLDVYHQLHCLKYIRHYIHPEYYNIVKTNVPSVDHVDHCIDSLRQLVMCRADASVQTYEWIPTLRIPWAKFEQTEHECTNWEALDSWAAERSFDIYDPKMLRHPTKGTSFPPGWFEAQKLERVADPGLEEAQ